MGKVLAFKRPEADYEDVEALLRELAAEEREEQEVPEWLKEATRRAKEIPRMGGGTRPGLQQGNSDVADNVSKRRAATEAMNTQLGRKDLDRNVPIQARVAGTIYLSHAAFAAQLDDLVGAEASAWF